MAAQLDREFASSCAQPSRGSFGVERVFLPPMKAKSPLPLFLFLLTISSAAQQPAPAAQSNPPAAARPTAPVDPKLHAKAMQLTEFAGLRQQINSRIEMTLQQGKDETLRKSPQIDPAFGDEWVKRMRASMKVDEYVNVYVKAYEKYFTVKDLQELIDAQSAANDGRPITLSEPLQEKVKASAPLMQSEVLAGCAAIVARVGTETSLQLQKEHPEWFKAVQPADKPADKPAAKE